MFPEFAGFLNSISEEDAKSFAEAFTDGYQQENRKSLVEGNVALMLRILAAYHEWLSKSLQEKQQYRPAGFASQLQGHIRIS